jgi:ribosomal protein S18 acetylase RimI-like enzyme
MSRIGSAPHAPLLPLPGDATGGGDDAVVPVEVGEATEVTSELVDAFARLIPQLSSSNPPPAAGALREMILSPASVVLIARDPERDREIVGSLTLVLFRIPTGMRAWIEDVVVDGEARGRGVGSALTLAALDRARAAGCTTVDLTSRPSREAANRLYQRLGFEARETNVYRYTL